MAYLDVINSEKLISQSGKDPDNNHKMIGYYSVRRKPSLQALAVIEPIYKEMLTAEKNSAAKNAMAVSTALLITKLEQQGVSYEQFALSI